MSEDEPEAALGFIDALEHAIFRHGCKILI